MRPSSFTTFLMVADRISRSFRENNFALPLSRYGPRRSLPSMGSLKEGTDAGSCLPIAKSTLLHAPTIMKKVISISLGLVSSVALANPNYVNTVRQVQEDTGIEWDVTVAPFGEMLSPEGVGTLGSNYELWTLNAQTGEPTFLDEEFVSSFTPKGEIEIITGDPFEAHKRTRVDKPFSVTRKVKGLLNKPDAPAVARKVSFQHALFAFPEGLHAFESENPEGVLFEVEEVTKNGNRELNFAESNLSPNEGQEVFGIYALGQEGEFSELLDEQTVTVWPKAEVEFRGLDNSSYNDLPPFTIALTDLYPDSNTFVRVYRGEAVEDLDKAPADAAEIRDSDLIIADVEPQDRNLTLSGLGETFTEGGVWTIEVLHRTPWGLERLGYRSPTVNNSMKVRAGLYSK